MRIFFSFFTHLSINNKGTSAIYIYISRYEKSIYIYIYISRYEKSSHFIEIFTRDTSLVIGRVRYRKRIIIYRFHEVYLYNLFFENFFLLFTHLSINNEEMLLLYISQDFTMKNRRVSLKYSRGMRLWSSNGFDIVNE